MLKNKPKKGAKYYLELEARLKEIIDDINYRVALVLVEGIRDEESLRKIGVKRPVTRFCDSKLPTFAFVEDVTNNYKGQTILVLFDFDKEGRGIAKKISRELEEKGVKVERFLRNEIAELLLKEGIWRMEDAYLIKQKAAY